MKRTIKNATKRILLSCLLTSVLAVSAIGVVPSAEIYAEEIDGLHTERLFGGVTMILRMLTTGTTWAALIHLKKPLLKYGRRKRLRLCYADMKREMAVVL